MNENIEIPREPELTTGPVALCGADGLLNPNAAGWSRRPIHDCTLHRRWPRKKRWNYWCITSDRFLFSATLSTLDYAGLAFIYLLDFESKRFVERTWTVPFGRGMVLSDTVQGICEYAGQGIALRFDQTSREVTLSVHCRDFQDGPLDADLAVEIPSGHESLNVVIPWDTRHYQFTSKQHAMPVSGRITWSGGLIDFGAADAFACLDFGRGVWPYRCAWNWGGGSGRTADRSTIGLNLGGKWTDGTGMTENGVVVDGVLRKISDGLVWEYDTGDFMRSWRIRTRRTEEVDLEFLPFYERVAKSNLLIIRSEVHQLIGTWRGTIVAPDGKRLDVDGIIGWAEEHHARW